MEKTMITYSMQPVKQSSMVIVFLYYPILKTHVHQISFSRKEATIKHSILKQLQAKLLLELG